MATSPGHGEDSPYFAGLRAYDKDPYDPVHNPNGVIQMGLAENQVSIDLLENILSHHPDSAAIRTTALFQDYHGLQASTKGMACFMERIRGGRVQFDPNRIVLTAGATAANELLTFLLADPGDAFLVPTPYYPGFDRDLKWRTWVEIILVDCYSSDGFQLSVGSLRAAYDRAESLKRRVKALLITNPSNPLGKAASRRRLEEAMDFAAEKRIHLISDEIYSGSVFSATEFVSLAEVVEARGAHNCTSVHIVYSISKDLGLPGFRVGTVYSYDDRVVCAARRMSSFCLVSSQTQRTLATMLSDEEFTGRYLETNRERLRERRKRVVGALREVGVECLKGDAGLFCWVNFGGFLEEKTTEGELRLWKLMLEDSKINVSPGSACHCAEPGWFRVCFANMSTETLDVALTRLQVFAEKIANEKKKTTTTRTSM
ncbi:hypothetical protein HPP92_002469 [Vanilla planifolia]|uniref:Aminotransferase class I/classII large domain-containing protein n=1 Tax=Vanilla planifolia TaxID=51239 RepID=A0A835SER3_VANPL|nr:hypothetical protein HPP92_002469 [Vanilla planifolia]